MSVKSSQYTPGPAEERDDNNDSSFPNEISKKANKDENAVAREDNGGWEGPDDPNNPLNFPKFTRIGYVVLASIMTLLANLGSTIYAPAAEQLLANFGITNATLGTLSVTIYPLGFAIGPLFISPLSELYGRLYVYHICNITFVAFCVGCALSTNITEFLIFRFITGSAGSAPLTIGGGTVADVTPVDQRGAAMAVFAMGPLLGPVVGPVIGGFVAEDLGWQWTFWLLAIMAGTVTFIAFLTMRETYAPVLLRRKYPNLKEASGPSPTAIFSQALLRPLRLLFLSPIVLLLSTYTAFVFGLTFLLFTTFSSVFEEQYGFGPGIAGLSYLGLGVGMILGLLLFGTLSDKVLKQKSGTNISKPEYRLPLMVWFSPTIPIGFFCYGWSAAERTHWIVPILGTGVIGIGSLFVIMPAQIYLVDVFGAKSAASALAANTILRALFGTFLPLAGPYMYQALGLGWGNSLLGFVALAFVPVPFLFYKYGEWVRQRWVIKV